jgi:hypothetical protein
LEFLLPIKKKREALVAQHTSSALLRPKRHARVRSRLEVEKVMQLKTRPQSYLFAGNLEGPTKARSIGSTGRQEVSRKKFLEKKNTLESLSVQITRSCSL